MNPTEILRQEHQRLLLKLCEVEREVQAIQSGESVDMALPSDIARWYADFVCHHIKEERHLFRLLEQRATPADLESFAVLKQEHEEARERTASFAEALPKAARGEAAAVATIKEHLAAFLKGLRGHIAREENVLFPLADRILLPEDQKTLIQAFAVVGTAEKEEIRKKGIQTPPPA